MKSVDGNEHIELRTGKLPLGVDRITRTLQVIDYSHHEIHAGSHFMYTDHQVIANGASGDAYLITVPNSTKWPHMWFDLDGSAITDFLLYEGADRVGTTPQTVGNSNRNSDTAATMLVHKGTSGGTTDGTLLHRHKGGSATNQSRAGMNTGNNEEIILKQNTKYLLRAISGTDANLVNIKLEWYEHANKS